MRIPVPDDIPAAEDLGVVHLVGIGGAGLSAIARLMAQRGIRVQGSDAVDSPVLGALRAEGITCFVGQRAENLVGVDTVIASTAVRVENPEIVETLRLGLRLWPRSAGLKSLMTDRLTVAVAGTHGKTTTTAMTACALIGAGADPGFAIGAEVAALGTNARAGSGPLLVVEADESDGAFLHYGPRGAVVTNVDADHLDVWGTPQMYAAGFERFIGTVDGFVVLSADDPGARALAGPAQERGLTVTLAGFADDADVRGVDLSVGPESTTFTVHWSAGSLPVRLAVPGRHYGADALLAIATALQLGFEAGPVVAGLATYTGAARRMEFKGQAGGVTVYDSYAHHPTEIAADLAAARQIAGPERLVVAYQPHLVSRTRLFGHDMGVALSAADEVFVADIYLARENPDPAVTSALVADAVSGPPAHLSGPVAGTAAIVAAALRPGDVLLTLGAGDITTVGPQVLDLLGSRPTT